MNEDDARYRRGSNFLEMFINKHFRSRYPCALPSVASSQSFWREWKMKRNEMKSNWQIEIVFEPLWFIGMPIENVGFKPNQTKLIAHRNDGYFLFFF